MWQVIIIFALALGRATGSLLYRKDSAKLSNGSLAAEQLPNCSLPADFREHAQIKGMALLMESERYAVYGMDDGVESNLFAFDCTLGKHLMFVHIPKNAGTTIEHLGRDHRIQWGMFKLKGQQKMPDGNTCNAWHVPPSLLAGYNPYLHPRAEVFCVTRDPWERLVSEYVYELSVYRKWPKFSRFVRGGPPCSIKGLNKFAINSINKMLGGERWISDCHMLPQWDYIESESGRQYCTSRLSITELTPQFNALMQSHGIPLRMAPHNKKNSAVSTCPKLRAAADLNMKSVLWKVTQNKARRLYSRDFAHIGDALA
jgi:hypothetical protein